jgi:hypothetical protein
VATPDRGGAVMHRGGQAQRPQVRPVEEPEEVRQSMAIARAKERDQTFRAGHVADRESMAGLFQRGKVVKRPLLVGWDAFDGVDHDHRVEVVQHSRPPRHRTAARGVQFPVSLGILGQARLVFGEQVCRRPPGEAAGALIGRDLPDHVGQAALLRSNGRGGTDRHSHGTGR